MCWLSNYFLLLLLSFYLARANADCQLTNREILETNRIFAFRSGNQNFLPQRLTVVPTGQTLDMICNEHDVRQITCGQNSQFHPSLPMTDCSKPIKPIVEPITDTTCPYTMYRVGYKLNDREFLEIYRSCYENRNVTAHFTIHLVYPNTMSFIGRPMQSFTKDNIISGANAASFEARNIYQRFEQLLGPHQTYVTSARDLIFDRGHLAPSADFIFHQRLTFKYINIVAQFRTINRSNWNKIENWIRRQLTLGHYSVLQICTGGLGVLQLTDRHGHIKPVYLINGQRNPVPKWLYKIVSDGAGNAFVFLTLNNVHANRMPSPNPECQAVACPASIQLMQTKQAGYTFCCEPRHFIARNLPHLNGFI